MYSTQGRGQIDSEDCKYHCERSGVNLHTLQWVDYLSYKYIF